MKDKLMTILRDETNKRTDVSFHFRHPIPHTSGAPAYIECSVGAPGAGGNGIGPPGAGGDTNANKMEQGLGFQIEMPRTDAPAGSSAQPAPSAPPSTSSIFSTLAGSSYDAGFGMIGSGVNGK
jgi:hypothetical protein